MHNPGPPGAIEPTNQQPTTTNNRKTTMKLLIYSRKYPLKARFCLKGKAIFVCVYECNVCQGEEQICQGGRFRWARPGMTTIDRSGDTVLFLGDLQSDFDKKCRSWWRQFMAKKEAMPGGRPIECWS